MLCAMGKIETNHQIIDRDGDVRFFLRSMNRKDIDSLPERDAMVYRHHLLVVKIAAEYRHQGLELSDLIMSGMRGLVLAIDHYDAGYGVDFAPYACRWIRGEISRELTACGHPIRMTKYARQMVKRICQLQSSYYAVHEREATAEELSEMTGYAVETITSLMLCTARFASLDAPLGEGEDSYMLSDTVATEEEGEVPSSGEILAPILAKLPPREREIVERVHLGGEDFRSIGRALHLSSTRVRQIYRLALLHSCTKMKVNLAMHESKSKLKIKGNGV